jgi:hypothetical protein
LAGAGIASMRFDFKALSIAVCEIRLLPLTTQ